MASGHHETACELLVCSMRSARNREIEEFFARGEFRRALAETPARCAVERRVLQHLCISPADYSGALGSLPRRQRLLFARSFASLLWNQASGLVFSRAVVLRVSSHFRRLKSERQIPARWFQLDWPRSAKRFLQGILS